jgi:hypothetical protein
MKTCKHPTCIGSCRREKPEKKTYRIKKIGFKQAELLKRYSDLRIGFLKTHPICEVDGCGDATDVHHKKGRGKYLLDVETWLAVSRSCHQKIEENPEWAKENGYSLSRLNDQK